VGGEASPGGEGYAEETEPYSSGWKAFAVIDGMDY